MKVGNICHFTGKTVIDENIFQHQDEDFVIVEGVDGVVFIMVIIFVIGTIIFLAIVAASTALKKNMSLCKF
jgi:hypothetical protein